MNDGFSAGFIGAILSPTLGVHQMQIKHLTLEVSSGDITKERCDAVVNSSNQTFSLKSGDLIPIQYYDRFNAPACGSVRVTW